MSNNPGGDSQDKPEEQTLKNFTPMRLEEFSYKIPEGLIAQRPLSRREQARLMVVHRLTGKVEHDIFANLGQYLPPRSLLVLNDSKVIPARLFGRRERTGGQVEIFVLKQLPDRHSFKTLLRPLRRLKEGEKIVFDGCPLSAQIVDIPGRIVRFNTDNLFKYLDRIGHMPLPPYIKRLDVPEDKKFYQTVFAKRRGSVAAPTAGLHFTPALLSRLKKDGHQIQKVTLHINHATFKPVEVKDITEHKMHEEEYAVCARAWKSIVHAREGQRKIVAVGTTSSRVLETIANGGKLSGMTDLFIYPGYQFKMVDILITNFHLSQSTLLMLTYAFGSKQLIARAYQEAIRQRYRFYSYGDAMMII